MKIRIEFDTENRFDTAIEVDGQRVGLVQAVLFSQQVNEGFVFLVNQNIHFPDQVLVPEQYRVPGRGFWTGLEALMKHIK